MPTPPLTRIPVRHVCGHFEARLTRWNADLEAINRGFLIAGSKCSTCSPNDGRGTVRPFITLEAAKQWCAAENDKLSMTNIDKATAILRATHDGDDLEPVDLKLVEMAVNNRLTHRSIAAFAEMYEEVSAGNYVPSAPSKIWELQQLGATSGDWRTVQKYYTKIDADTALPKGSGWRVKPPEEPSAAAARTSKKSPLELARKREETLANGLRHIAKSHGVTLKEPLQIDSNGEFSIVSIQPFGTLAAILTQHHPRCGVQPGAILVPSNSWCRMNHFDVERMLISVAATLQ